jgi:hypothetical protein
MGHYIVKRNQSIGEEENLFNFYYYGELDNEGTPLESYWGIDSEKKKIFSNRDDANLILEDLGKIPPNFIGVEIVEE